MFNVEEWENKMLALPLARQVSGEHDQHKHGDPDYLPWFDEFGAETGRCKCDRCNIIRIKQRRAFKFPRVKCAKCGALFFALFSDVCEECEKEGDI